MTLRSRLLPVGALVVAIGASAAGAATAADTGKGNAPKPDPASRQAIVKCEGAVGGDKAKDGKSDKGSQPAQKKTEPDWNAVAGQLGATAQQLQDALMDTKVWMGGLAHPTPDMFLQHIADLLHQPVAKVKTVLYDADVLRDKSSQGDKPGEPADKTIDTTTDKSAGKTADDSAGAK
jgi:hypothetical protein